jgi:hypothetical protein
MLGTRYGAADLISLLKVIPDGRRGVRYPQSFLLLVVGKQGRKHRGFPARRVNQNDHLYKMIMFDSDQLEP